MSEMRRYQCLDERECGETFHAWPSEPIWCPYCREMAERVHERTAMEGKSDL